MSTYISSDSKIRGEELSVLPELSGSDRYAALGTPALDSLDKKLSREDEEESGQPSPKSASSHSAERLEDVKDYQRKLPKIQYRDGPGAFVGSIGHRLRAVFTPRLLLCIAVSAHQINQEDYCWKS